MKTLAVIFTDVAGYPNRREQLRRIAAEFGGSFLAISPPDMELGIPQVDIPREWEDKGNPKLKNGKGRGVYRTARAISLHAIDADYFVHVEGDMHGDDAAWRALFRGMLNVADFDLACAFPRRSRSGTWQCFVGITILSNRAMGWLIQDAAVTASRHNERAVPETVSRHGGKIIGLRSICRKAISRRSIRFCTERTPSPRPLIRDGLLSHPCKFDLTK